ncbi:MAG TPA: SRPBCC family protein [Opitutaceae bacterium]|nr:SRPBCC family protein [Opitutaceae bacterium]
MRTNEQLGELRGAGEVRFVRTLPGPIETVWAFLTEPEKRSRWFAGGPMEPCTGGKVRLQFLHRNLAPDETPPDEYREVQESGMEMHGTVTRWEPPRVLAYTFSDASEVTFELTPRGDEVLLVLTHRSQPADLPEMGNFSAGWHTHLAHLQALLAGGPRPPFWSQFLELKEQYERRRAAAFAA